MMIKIGVSTLILLATSSLAGARPWTDTQGRVIEAEFVSSDGKSVVIAKGGKEFTLPIERLSEADQKWLAEQSAAGSEEETKEGTPEGQGKQTGLISDHPVSVLFRNSPDEWAEGKAASACSREEKFSTPLDKKNQQGFEDCVSAPDQRCMVYIPASYDGSEAYGVYLHISPGNGGSIPKEYYPIFDKLKIIAVSAHSTSNQHAHWERVSRSMNALATVRAEWKTDPNRTYVGGLSGGGHMAFLTQALFSSEFRGAISHAAQSYPPGPNYNEGGHFGPISPSDFRRGRRAQNYWLIFMGTEDKRNYPEIAKTEGDWKALPVTYRCVEIEGHGHKIAPPKEFEEGLAWLESNPDNTKEPKGKD
ncbi:hypothetical protein ACFQY0_09105 [Haloferula chungangensis]|uniref:SLA1 homology domain-containing protein n=1 Tax=Haloferula chungangensis TaxID=1048331 RepID=A0ABW2L724_9BACT